MSTGGGCATTDERVSGVLRELLKRGPAWKTWSIAATRAGARPSAAHGFRVLPAVPGAFDGGWINILRARSRVYECDSAPCLAAYSTTARRRARLRSRRAFSVTRRSDGCAALRPTLRTPPRPDWLRRSGAWRRLQPAAASGSGVGLPSIAVISGLNMLAKGSSVAMLANRVWLTAPRRVG